MSITFHQPPKDTRIRALQVIIADKKKKHGRVSGRGELYIINPQSPVVLEERETKWYVHMPGISDSFPHVYVTCRYPQHNRICVCIGGSASSTLVIRFTRRIQERRGRGEERERKKQYGCPSIHSGRSVHSGHLSKLSFDHKFDIDRALLPCQSNGDYTALHAHPRAPPCKVPS